MIYRWFPPTIRETPTARAYAQRELVTLGAASPREWALTVVFIGLAIVWATHALYGVDTTVTGLAGLCVLLLSGVLAWSDIVGETRAWDTFVWWGAMMSLATALNQSAVPKRFATTASHTLAGWPALAALVAVVADRSACGHGARASLRRSIGQKRMRCARDGRWPESHRS